MSINQDIVKFTMLQCGKLGVKPSLAFAVLGNESSGGQQFYKDTNDPIMGSATAHGTAVGAYQVLPETAQNIPPPYSKYLVYDAGSGSGVVNLTSSAGNAAAGVAYLAYLQDKFPGNQAAQLAAYYAGEGTVLKAIADTGGDMSGTAFLNAPSMNRTQAGKAPTIAQYVSKALGIAGGSSPSFSSNEAGPVAGLVRNPVAQQVVAMDKPTVNFNDLFPDVIVNTGLREVPWYKDTGLVTGNPKVRGSITPVMFEVVLKGRDNEILSESSTSDMGSAYRPGNPIQVQLNASMKTFSVSSKHVFHPQRTRTAWHITMWGMQADTIEGNCTTGVFMNQLGITDFFSTAGISQDLITEVTKGFQHFSVADVGELSSQSRGVLAGTGSTGEVLGAEVKSNDLASLVPLLSKNGPPLNAQEMFRVAAQDAFVEFLFLFKNNGVVWFNSQDALGDNEQVGVDQWSPELGMAATNRNARNNDVMSRGTVIMKFKGTSYMGYFKSLNWSQDAINPFQWTFNFVFQVERTLGYVFSPTYRPLEVVTTRLYSPTPEELAQTLATS